MSSPASGGIFKNPTSYADPDFGRFIRGAFLDSAGFDADDRSRPVIGIADTSSDYTTCHRDLPQVIAAIRRGVSEAGGLPMVFPTCSLPEIVTSPTTMLYRNLLAMECEEMIRCLPMDAVVLVGGCDKTTPAQLMAAVSADVPAIHVVSGPMRTGSWAGERIGACTDCRRFWAEHRAGALSRSQIERVQQALCPTGGTCMVMGTASTMACLLETLGMMLPGGATAASGSGDRLRNAVASGRCAVGLARADVRPKRVLTEAAFRNALTVLCALGGSTNAVIHLTAIARRCGIRLTLDDFHDASQRTPVLVDCKPAGRGYLDDLHVAGGVPALLKAIEPLLDRSTRGVTGRTLGQLLADVPPRPEWQTTVRSIDDPVKPPGSLVALRGTLAPRGAVLKASACSGELLTHRGRAVVFESPEDVARRIDDPALRITPQHVLVLRNAGPVGAGMPEAGSLPIPRYLGELGVKDMVRVSDARMSGTAYGTAILHCCPEAAVGGPLALVADDDLIELNVAERRLDLLVAPEVLAARRSAWKPPARADRGWRKLYADHVMGADAGADFDFLLPCDEGE
jgi:dihydroxy-acid dehydratase